MAGRKSIREELNVVRRYNELSPTVFKFVQEMLESDSIENKKWAADWIKPAYAKSVPQKIGGDPQNRTPIPLLYALHSHNSAKEDKPVK